MRWLPLFLLVPLLASAGCVSTPVKADRPEPALMIAQTSNGEASLLWESEPGYLYTIYYMDPPDGKWAVLKGTLRIRGTGESLTAHDRATPGKPARRYRLQVDKQTD